MRPGRVAAALLTLAAAPGPVELVLIEKRAHAMTLFAGGGAVARYRVALGQGGLAPKEREGDARVPEGEYRITGRNARSAYHRSLRIGYPRSDQVAAARRAGIDPGGDVMIHGLPNGRGWVGALHRRRDWTLGCVAVTDAEMDEVWRRVPVGARVRIVP